MRIANYTDLELWCEMSDKRVRISVASDDGDDSFIGKRESRLSRNSTGFKEEFLIPREDEVAPTQYSPPDKSAYTKELLIVFILMVFVGLGNKVFNKLMTLPMYNYPNFLNLLTTFVYIPVSFAYIMPMVRSGTIPRDQADMPKKPFAVMGALDAIAGIMQVFSATYLPGPLLILLSQAAIPMSMIISSYLLKARYNKYQYLGAITVAGGIICVLAPNLAGGGNVLWSIMMILSTIPMALSSVYKEIALGERELDPIFLNGWIAIFQFIFSLVLCVPSSLASSPPVPIPDLPANLWAGLKCFGGTDTQTCESGDSDCHKDRCFPDAPMFVTIYLCFNIMYNILIILILKYGSANLLFMALTLMVPLGNAAFTLPFVPSHQTLKATDIVGLVIICIGLACYRFAAPLIEKYFGSPRTKSNIATTKLFHDDSKQGLDVARQMLLAEEDEGKPEP